MLEKALALTESKYNNKNYRLPLDIGNSDKEALHGFIFDNKIKHKRWRNWWS